CGMVEGMADKNVRPTDERPIIAATMFGNTTECVNACREALTREGFEVLVFHATGTGGRTMESLVDEGLVDGVLDITTTEWADGGDLCQEGEPGARAGGVFDSAARGFDSGWGWTAILRSGGRWGDV